MVTWLLMPPVNELEFWCWNDLQNKLKLENLVPLEQFKTMLKFHVSAKRNCFIRAGFSSFLWVFDGLLYFIETGVLSWQDLPRKKRDFISRDFMVK